MTDQIRVWDRFVRLFHWSLVLLIGGAWLAAAPRKLLHERLGYAVALLIAARLVWGFVGPRHARFADFLRGPRAVAGYLRALAGGRAPHYLGHNPAGGAMIAALLAVIAAVVLTGWLQTTDAWWGSPGLERLHEALVWLLVGLVGVHVLGVGFESWRQGENLPRAMLTGRKRRPAQGDEAQHDGAQR